MPSGRLKKGEKLRQEIQLGNNEDKKDHGRFKIKCIM
jgi:hypothetical protein